MAKRSWSEANGNGINISTSQVNAPDVDQPMSARSYGRNISFSHQPDSFLDPTGNQNSGDDASPNSVPSSSAGAQAQCNGSARTSNGTSAKRARKSSGNGNEKPVGLQDGQPPPTTPRTRACAACRKQKIKCILENDQSRCTRCIRRNLSCELNRSLQSLVDEQRQIDMLRNDVIHLHEKLTAACGLLDLALPGPLQITQDNARENANGESHPGEMDGADNMGEDSLPMSPDGPAQAPIESFLNIAKLGSPQATNQDADRSSRSKLAPEPDIISKGIVSQATAERLVDRYFSRLDHYIWASGYQYTDLQSLRRASPMLLACICTVSALHEIDDGQLYEVCNSEFRRLMSRSLFEKRDVEYLRGLCIGSYWLSDISRIISSDAIRRAVDMRLQRFLYQVTDPEVNAQFHGAYRNLDEATKMDRVRLWYLLYIEDQHLSILYNRDPIMREQERVLNHEAFLESTHSTNADVRMISQVALLLVMSQIRETFGPDMGEQVSKNLTPQLNNFSRQIDHWYARWSPLLKPNEHIGTFPNKGLMMHFNFAKVYLGHHVFRGLSHPSNTSSSSQSQQQQQPSNTSSINNNPTDTKPPTTNTTTINPTTTTANPNPTPHHPTTTTPPLIPAHLKPTALMAHSSALAILDLLLSDLDLQKSLLGMPAYYHIMITFAANFLLASSTYHDQLGVAQDTVFRLVADVINLLQSTRCIAQHPLRRMSGGLARKLDVCLRRGREVGSGDLGGGGAVAAGNYPQTVGEPAHLTGATAASGMPGAGTDMSHHLLPNNNNNTTSTSSSAGITLFPNPSANGSSTSASAANSEPTSSLWTTTTTSDTTSTTPSTAAHHGLMNHGLDGTGDSLYFDPSAGAGAGGGGGGGGLHMSISPEFDLQFLEFEEGDFLGGFGTSLGGGGRGF